MAINIKFDLINNPEPPTLVLANRNGNKLGQLEVNIGSIELVDKLNDASEISFMVNKYIDNRMTNLWNDLVDFKLVYCKEWNCWFECKVELDESTESVKTVFCTQLGQAELSQIMLYDIEINTEADIERDDYKIGILYDSLDSKSSILNRLLEKAPHYSIIHVDDTIKNIQRSFSFSDISVYDAFQEIAKEIGCLFIFNSDSDEHGMPNRTISVYDLQQNCNDCGYRGEFTDKCPKCGSTYITYGYGEDTLIFVTSDELASDGIQLVTDTDSVKNCFKLEAGDDLMTATIRNRNPNGTDYIWYFSDATKEDMPDEMVEKIESYDEKYKYYYNEYASNLNADLLSQYNTLVRKYSAYKDDLKMISTPIQGYSNLMQAYYNAIDLGWYLKSGLMPDITMAKTSAEEQGLLLSASLPSLIAVTDLKIVSKATADSSVLTMAKAIVNSSYKVTIDVSQLVEGEWTGSFIITNYSDDEDTYTTPNISRTLTDSDETYILQKIEKILSKENTDDVSITGLFAKDYNEFCIELKKYALTPLASFRDACQACIDILIKQGAGNKDMSKTEKQELNGDKPDSDGDLYEKLYVPYYNKLIAIESEMALRESEVNVVFGVYDVEGNLITDGLQANIEKLKSEIQKELNFQDYLGEDLWLQFCSYRREDKYHNENYVSDGLNNAELFERALEFYEVAENEIFKSAELQHSISATLNNLLAIPKFKPLAESFNLGNWIRVQIDDYIYKLRIIEYEISYDSFENISVTFSDVTKIKNGFTDIESVLSQASAMATSYGYVQKQAKQGDEAQGTIDDWLSAGLNSALVRIQSNNTEDISISKNGLLCRSYDDVTDGYSPEQLKLTHNIMAYTDDNWKTVKQAIGKHDYKTYSSSDDDWLWNTGYGMSAEFVTAGQIMGSKIVGGEIYSSNYHKGTAGDEKDLAQGTYINLESGDFSFAGGKLVFESDNDALTLKDITIQWSSLKDPPAIEDITNLSDVLDQIDGDILTALKNAKDYTDSQDTALKDYTDLQDAALKEYADTKDAEITQAYKTYADSGIKTLDDAVARHLGINGTTLIHEKAVISPYLGGGYLNITGIDNGIRVLIDPNNLTGNGYVFQVLNGNTVNVDGSIGKVVVGVDENGNATFSGMIVGGSIASLNYTETYKSGTYMNLNEGDFSLASGKISYDSTTNVVTLQDVTLQWKNEEDRLESSDLSDYLNQLDERIQSFSQSEDPSLQWDDEEKLLHVGDLWFNPDNGLTHRWDGSEWELVTDSNLEKLAKSKAQIFTHTPPDHPEPPYYVGDLWVQGEPDTEGTGGDILHCFQTREIGDVYDPSDWKLCKYDAISKEAKEIGDTLVKELGFQKTEIGDSYVISPAIVGGYLNITNVDNGSKVVVDPHNLTNNNYIFQVHNGSEISVGITTDGNASFSGDINAKSLTLGEDVKISNNNLELDTETIIFKGDITQHTANDSNGNLYTVTTVPTSSGTFTYHTYDADDYIVFGRSKGTNAVGQNYISVSKEGLLTARNALIYGTVYATDGEFAGKVTASEGEIGGWDIATTYIGSTLNTSAFYIATANDSAGYWLRAHYGNTMPFSVSHQGVLRATNVDISGTINATSGSFTGTINATSGNFSDSVTIGDSTITAGAFRQLYNYAIGGTGTAIQQINATSGSVGGWTIDGNTRIWYNNGVNNAIYLGKDGIEYYLGNNRFVVTKGYDGHLMTTISSGGGAFGFTIGNSEITMSAPTLSISSGTTLSISGTTLSISGTTLSMSATSSLNITSPTLTTTSNGGTLNGAWSMMFGNTAMYVTQVSGYFFGTWSFANATIITSDRDRKNSIESLDDRYSTLFDNLTPTRFKYNDGTSGRYHTGFIAQDVENSILNAGLTTQEVAAFVTINKDTEDAYSGLRYSEFVALNTWQIQKLKKRVEELESKIKELS